MEIWDQLFNRESYDDQKTIPYNSRNLDAEYDCNIGWPIYALVLWAINGICIFCCIKRIYGFRKSENKSIPWIFYMISIASNISILTSSVNYIHCNRLYGPIPTPILNDLGFVFPFICATIVIFYLFEILDQTKILAPINSLKLYQKHCIVISCFIVLAEVASIFRLIDFWTNEATLFSNILYIFISIYLLCMCAIRYIVIREYKKHRGANKSRNGNLKKNYRMEIFCGAHSIALSIIFCTRFSPLFYDNSITQSCLYHGAITLLNIVHYFGFIQPKSRSRRLGELMFSTSPAISPGISPPMSANVSRVPSLLENLPPITSAIEPIPIGLLSIDIIPKLEN